MNEDERWKTNEDEHRRYEQAILELHAAVYGDKDGSMGMKKQLQDMYGVFVPVTMTGKAIIKTIMFLGAAAAAVTAVLELIGILKHQK